MASAPSIQTIQYQFPFLADTVSFGSVTSVGNVERITFGANEYEWHQEGVGGPADPDGPSAGSTVQGSADTLYLLPRASITILRGKITE
jgi:hypothetical protein